MKSFYEFTGVKPARIIRYFLTCTAAIVFLIIIMMIFTDAFFLQDMSIGPPGSDTLSRFTFAGEYAGKALIKLIPAVIVILTVYELAKIVATLQETKFILPVFRLVTRFGILIYPLLLYYSSIRYMSLFGSKVILDEEGYFYRVTGYGIIGCMIISASCLAFYLILLMVYGIVRRRIKGDRIET